MMFFVAFTLELIERALNKLFIPLLADHVVPALVDIATPLLSSRTVVILVATVHAASRHIISPLAGILTNLTDSIMGGPIVRDFLGTSLVSPISNIYSYCVFGTISFCLRFLNYPDDPTEIFATYFLTDLVYQGSATNELTVQTQEIIVPLEDTQASGSREITPGDNTVTGQLDEDSNDYFEKIIVDIMKETNLHSISTTQATEVMDKSGFDDWWKLIEEELGVHDNVSTERPLCLGDDHNLSRSTLNSIVLNVAGTPVPPSAIKLKAPVLVSRPFTGIHRLNVNTLNCCTELPTSTPKPFPSTIYRNTQAGLRKRKTDENRAPSSSYR